MGEGFVSDGFVERLYKKPKAPPAAAGRLLRRAPERKKKSERSDRTRPSGHKQKAKIAEDVFRPIDR